MTIGQEQLLAFSKFAIHSEGEIPEVLKRSSIEWADIFNEAEKQSLLGIAFVGYKVWSNSAFALNRTNLNDKRLFTQWFLLCEKIKEDNLRLNRRSSQICKRLSSDGFRVSIMKGQGNALLYGKELMLLRNAGDIDVWIDSDFHRLYDYVKSLVPIRYVSEKEIVFDVFSDAEVELHYRPYIMRNPFRNRKLQAFFKQHADACFRNNVQLKIINKDGEEAMAEAVITTISFNLVHQLAHIHRHLFAVGIGLRHVMDYYFQLVQAEKSLSEEQKDEVVRVVKSIGLEKLAKALSWILSEYLGLPPSCQLWEPNKEDGEFLLEDILKTGNFGHGDEILSSENKKSNLGSLLYVLKHNWAMSRFDRTDWFWGPYSRICAIIWRKRIGFSG